MNLWEDFYRRGTGPVPIEPPAAVRAMPLLFQVDEQLEAIADVPPPVREQEMWEQLDRLLDVRSEIRRVWSPPATRVRLRPSVPVIPGRTS